MVEVVSTSRVPRTCSKYFSHSPAAAVSYTEKASGLLMAAGVDGHQQERAAHSVVAREPSPSGQPQQVCPSCGESVFGGTRAMKRHRNSKCGAAALQLLLQDSTAAPCGPRAPVVVSGSQEPGAQCCRPGCRKSRAQHVNEDCPYREIVCASPCGAKLPQYKMHNHEALECPLRKLGCPHCDCLGPAFQQPGHVGACGLLEVVCSACFQEMPQNRMLSHQCPISLVSEDMCLVCRSPFEDMLEDSPPANLFRNGVRACRCSTYTMCVQCAGRYLEIMEKTHCPSCREMYDAFDSVPVGLIVRRGDNQKPARRRPLPSPANAPAGSFHFVSPLDIRFTHDSISPVFRDFPDPTSGQQRQGLSILVSLREQISSACAVAPRTLDILDVCWHEDLLYLAGTGNRRLAMWRLLTIFCEKNCSCVKVRVVERDAPAVKFFQKLTTKCRGATVRVRREDSSKRAVGVGVANSCSSEGDIVVGQTAEETSWQEAMEMFFLDYMGTLFPDNVGVAAEPGLVGGASTSSSVEDRRIAGPRRRKMLSELQTRLKVHVRYVWMFWKPRIHQEKLRRQEAVLRLSSSRLRYLWLFWRPRILDAKRIREQMEQILLDLEAGASSTTADGDLGSNSPQASAGGPPTVAGNFGGTTVRRRYKCFLFTAQGTRFQQAVFLIHEVSSMRVRPSFCALLPRMRTISVYFTKRQRS